MIEQGRIPLADRIMALVSETPGVTDRELTDNLMGAGSHPSQVNQACRFLESNGRLARSRRADGLIGNYPAGVTPVAMPSIVVKAANAESLSEDEVKEHLRRWLERDGWQTEIAWGKARGTDIVARRGGESWLIEVKGCGSRSEMRLNYFIGMLGELLQRMSIEDARYSIAMPDIQRFRRLWDRLPDLARRRTGITAMFVSAGGEVDLSGGSPGGQGLAAPSSSSGEGLIDPQTFRTNKLPASSLLSPAPHIDMMCECVDVGKEPCLRHPCETFAERMFRSGYGRVE